MLTADKSGDWRVYIFSQDHEKIGNRKLGPWVVVLFISVLWYCTSYAIDLFSQTGPGKGNAFNLEGSVLVMRSDLHNGDY